MCLVIVGSAHKNKRDNPPELLQLSFRKNRTSMYCFDQAKTLMSEERNPFFYYHEKPNINKNSKNPEMIEFFNSTTGFLNILSQMCHSMSYSTKIRLCRL